MYIYIYIYIYIYFCLSHTESVSLQNSCAWICCVMDTSNFTSCATFNLTREKGCHGVKRSPLIVKETAWKDLLKLN